MCLSLWPSVVELMLASGPSVQKTQLKKSKRCSVTLTGDSVWLIISWGVGGSWGEGRTRGGAGFPSHMH